MVGASGGRDHSSSSTRPPAEGGGGGAENQWPGLYQFLLQFRVEKGGEFTHTSFSRPSGSFYVPGQRVDEFFSLYKEAIRRGEDLYITEKHRTIGPAIVDLDFRFPLEADEKVNEPKRHYTSETIERFVALYCSCLARYVALSSFDVFVLEKPAPQVAKTLVKDGLHFEVPTVVSRPALQHLVRQDVLKRIHEALGALPLVNTYENVMDEAIIDKNNWLMYMSKKPSNVPYKVTRVLRYLVDDDKVLDVTDQVLAGNSPGDLAESLSIRNKFEETPVRAEVQNAVADFEQQMEERRKRKELVQTVMTNTPCATNNACDNLDVVNKLVDILDPARCDTYNEWIRVGWCLRNVDHRLLDKWIEFSRKSPKYVEGECARMWAHMRMGGLGMGTLHMWARTDSPERYKEIIRNDLTELINRSVSGTHHDIARVVHQMYRYEYVCASIRNRTWYEFRSHRWHFSDSACSLRKRISNEVFHEYTQCALYHQTKAVGLEKEEEQKRHMDTCNKLNAIAMKLKDTNFKDNIIRECCEMFYHEKFEEKLDSNCDLVGFVNGVYDLENYEFREGRPDDFISYTTGVNYVPYSEDMLHIAEIKHFWECLLPKETIREYVLTLLASFLSGHTREERFHIWTGSGCHAHDTDITMFDGTLKKVQDIVEGELLMGDDGTPRAVLELFRGRADMYRIVPAEGAPFVVNGDHVLSLKTSRSAVVSENESEKSPWRVTWVRWDEERLAVDGVELFGTLEEAEAFRASLDSDPTVVASGDVVDVTVKKFMANAERVGERHFNLYRPEFLDFPARDVLVDPYVLGTWLGDVHGNPGSNRFAAPTSADSDLDEILGGYGLLDDKHIPSVYKANSREVRAKLLAGILDTNAPPPDPVDRFTLTLEGERLVDDVVFVARSLGLACYKRAVQSTCCCNGRYEIDVVGACIEDRALERTKKAEDVLRVGFRIERVEDGDFYGFELDGNHRYLAGDFFVQHNSNGKSKGVELYDKALGDYTCKFPVTLLTQKRAASNAATSEIARAKGRRFACLQEPSEDERMNIGLLKELTGGDKVQARALYKEPVEFKPQWHIALLCNHLPHVPSDDGGTWRRIRVVEFTSKFVENPKAPNEFPVDLELSQKLDAWKEPFMSLLIEYYKHKYAKKKIVEPEEVTACTREYQRNNDHFADFLDSCFEKTGDDDDVVALTDAFNELKSWLRDENIPIRAPKKKEIQKYMERALGKSVSVGGESCHRGYRIRMRGSAGLIAAGLDSK